MMNNILTKLLELEQTRDDLEKTQKSLREQMLTLDKDEYLEKDLIYYKNKDELKQVNKDIEILNEALEILGK